MRIISGQAGSIPLQVPKSLTRPTTDRVREALFSSLAPRLAGSDVLDLFAGSGSLGIEALSRGAESAVFVDGADSSIEAIEANLAKARLSGGSAIRQDVTSYLSRIPSSRFDLLFADPPYARDEPGLELLGRLLNHRKLAEALRPEGLFLLESLASVPLPETSLWRLAKEKKYGTTRVSYLIPAA